ncbi:MAG: short-chain dehydrogenase [Nitrosomonadaceae bacterium]|nr:short-chain dehydrogenase [Nitrosomonadaceae bacterium]|tara:strand:+ start:2201 stop:2959 length:759 start_codon:yes stop_codon:yes gene_type:complete
MPLKVIITGASSGLGKALAKHYASLGANLGLIARNKISLEDLTKELDTDATFYDIDVRDAESMRSAANDFMKRYGCPDIVIANAGISQGTLTEYIEDSKIFESILSTNITGVVNSFQPFVTVMRAQNKGSLVGISSVASYRGLPGGGAYSASKAAVNLYLESLRVEMHGSEISVITICPGYIVTPMTENNPFQMPFIMTAEVAAKKIGYIINHKKLFSVIPWQMAIVARILKLLPNCIYDLLFSIMPRKPRK